MKFTACFGKFSNITFYDFCIAQFTTSFNDPDINSCITYIHHKGFILNLLFISYI